jgi:anthranilate phosphoribosyltransferase
MKLGPILEQIFAGIELSREQATYLMGLMVRGEATQAQAAGIMVALRAKGVTGSELAAFAEVLKENAITVQHEHSDLVEIVGTGGGSPSFNLSSGSSIVAAAAGAKVAKHGNRAVTSACGSADVLEALGLDLYMDIERLASMLDRCDIIFMLAPTHHPALRHIAPARRELGVRTVFNVLGPLANPAGVTRQVLGVYDRSLCRNTAEALQTMGSPRALVVHGDDGLDEISPVTTTYCIRVWEGQLIEETLSPKDFGLEPLNPADLQPADSVDGNAAIIRTALSDPKSPRAMALLPSSAAALWLGGVVNSLSDGAELALETIKSGNAMRKLNELVNETHQQ